MEYKVYDCCSYRIHTIKTDKFKTCSIEVMLRDKINERTITENGMLIDSLMYSCKKYPKRRDVAIALENLYNASIRGVSSRLGGSVLISFMADFLNPKYCDKGYLNEIVSLFFEMLTKPNIKDGEFDNRIFNIIKNRIKCDIESVKENATRYGFRRSLINMDSESPASYSMVGYLEDLENVTPSSLVKTYENVINNYVCDIYVIGNLDMNQVVKLIQKKFTRRTISDFDIELFTTNRVAKKKKDIIEYGKYEQDTFIMIHNLVDLTKRERDYVLNLYNVILGSGGLTSKLYKYLREDNSLCYSCSSMYQKYDQLLMIYAGIDKKDKEKCIKLVNKALTEMVNGDFTDDELENAKKTIVSSIKMNEDSLGGIINNYLFKELDDLDYFDEKIKVYKSITKKEIMQVAKKIKINLIYILAGE